MPRRMPTLGPEARSVGREAAAEDLLPPLAEAHVGAEIASLPAEAWRPCARGEGVIAPSR